MGYRHLTVSKAMKSNLCSITGINPDHVYVMYDCATPKFTTLTADQKLAIFTKLGLEQMWSKDKPILLLSSTSYTPDEDFMILVRALDLIDDKPTCPKI